MTDKKRCIKCETLKEIKDNFTKAYTRFCDSCWEKSENKELRRFQDTFLSGGKEIFCFEYPDATSFLAVTLPDKDDEEAKKKFIQGAKKRIDNVIKTREKYNKNDEDYQANIVQLERYRQWINYHVEEYENK